MRANRDSEETNMAVRAAWLHYAGGFTQAEVAKKLGLRNLKAHRLITRANREGLVKVYIDGDVAECLKLEDQLAGRFELNYTQVIPDFDQDELPLKALGIAGGQYLRRLLDNGEHTWIGVGHGRTLAACVDCLPRTPAPKTNFVSLLGGFSRKFSANPHDVIHRLAERTGAHAYVMPVPFYANTVQDRKVLLGQHGLAEVMALARRTELKIVGIGSVEADASLLATGMIEKSDIAAVKKAGGIGEILGHFFNDQGKSVNTSLSDRTMGLPLSDLQESQITAIAGGVHKINCINAVLQSRLLNGLITDERTARALVELEEIR